MNWPWYFILDLGIWGVAAAVMLWAWPRLDKSWRLTASLTAVLVMVLQVGNEVLSFNLFKAWSFSLEHNRLIGWNILGAPAEEYLFWFAFAWFLPFLYSGCAAAFREGKP